MGLGIDPQEFLEVIRPALARRDADALAAAVRERWMPVQIGSLLNQRDPDTRRVAAIVLGLVGDSQVVPCLIRALKDPDHQVNKMAEHGLWSIWFRSGDPQATPAFRAGVERMEVEDYPGAIRMFREAVRIDATFAEAYNQLAIAHFLCGDYPAALQYGCRTLRLLPMHFGAIAGLGHCYAELGDLRRALMCYRKALHINPNMPGIARAIEQISATLPDKNDSSGIYNLERGATRDLWLTNRVG